MQRLIHHARIRGIKVWLAIEMGSLAPNMARNAESVGPLPFHYIFGTFVHPLDPVNRDIQAALTKGAHSDLPGGGRLLSDFLGTLPETGVSEVPRFL